MASEDTQGQPTVDAPERGEIGVGSVPLSAVDHWIEDGRYVFRSIEFDCFAEDENFDTAVQKFIDNAEDLAEQLSDLIREDEATDNEADAAKVLLPRVFAIYRAADARRRRLNITFGRNRRALRGGWHPTSRPKSSTPALRG